MNFSQYYANLLRKPNAGAPSVDEALKDFQATLRTIVVPQVM
jgi:hypothetical protein